GVDEPLLAVRLELAAQVADVDVERVRVGPEVVAPDLLEDHVAREHTLRVREEQLEQLVLGARERDLARSASRGHRVAVELEVLEAQGAAGLPGLRVAPLERADT